MAISDLILGVKRVRCSPMALDNPSQCLGSMTAVKMTPKWSTILLCLVQCREEIMALLDILA